VSDRVLVLERDRDKDERMVMTDRTRDCLNLGSYNYLGFAGQDPWCTPAAKQAVFDFGVASCSSPCELGANQACDDLEELIRTFLGGSPLKEAVMVYGMGFATNSHTLPALMGTGSLIISDALNHTSIVEGARTAGAKVQVFAHNDPDDLDRVLYTARKNGQKGSGKPWSKILVIVEGTYSMEGEMCKLPELVRVKNKYGAYLYLDEAHSIGALGENGRGVCEKLGVDPSEVDIMMGTLTKSFGSFGGYIAASAQVIHALRTKSASAIYSNGMSPPCAVQAYRALQLIRGDDGSSRGHDKIKQLQSNSTLFYDGLRKMGAVVLGPGDSPVIPMMIYHPTKMFSFSRQCFQQHIAAVVVGFPAVPLLLSRARFCVSASHTTEDLLGALEEIKQVCGNLGLCYKPPTDADADAVVPAAASAEAAPARQYDVGSLPSWEAESLAPKNLQQSCWYPTTAQLTEEHVQLSTYNFLGLRKHPTILQAAAEVIEAFGVGSCGPRGFYGTLEPHLQLETDIAAFMGAEAAILYSFGSTTISSVIPAFAKPTDVLVMDEGINYNAQQGAALSRANIKWFRHNDMAHLEEVLAELEREDGLHSARLTRKAVRRRFLVTEGVFANSGELAPLVEISRLKKRHALRLILDDSLGFGVLGPNGRGSLEHFGLPVQTADILIGSLETVCTSVGGFCCGSNLVVDHQRLSGAGYVFSASLPPFLCAAASQAIACISNEPERRTQLVEANRAMRAALSAVAGCSISGNLHSPMMFVRWDGATEESIDLLAQSLMDGAATKIAVTQARFCPLEKTVPEPALRVCVTCELQGPVLKAVTEEMARALSKAIGSTAESSSSNAEGALLSSVAASPAGKPFIRHRRRDSANLIYDPKKLARSKSSDLSASASRQLNESNPDWSDKATDSHGSYCSIPVFALCFWVLQSARIYLEDQVMWGQKTTLMTLAKIRNPATDCVFLLFSIMGSEYATLPIGFWLSWNYNVQIGRMLITLYVVNIYLGSFTKNVFCLKRPAGTGDSDFGWPSIHCMTATSLPFFLLRWWSGNAWLWDQPDPTKTFLVHSSVFVLVFLVVTARLYFGRSSPADVQAGCFMGAGLLRLWSPYAAAVDRAVLSATSGWPLLALAVVALLLHPVPRRPQLNDTFVMTVKMVGFSTGYLLGFIGPAVLWATPLTLPSSNLLALVRWSIGMSSVFCTQWAASQVYLVLSQRTLRFLTESQEHGGGRKGVHITLRNAIRCIGDFLSNLLAGAVASWGMPHVFYLVDMVWAQLPF